MAINVSEKCSKQKLKTKSDMEFIHQQFKFTGGPYYGETKIKTFCTARHGERS